MRSLQLNRKHLKIIAIIAMVVDHTAWGFVDFYSPLGQCLHIIGRLTIPIMCFFIAEGYKKTTGLRKYIGRMVIFWLITIVPFYLFFHEEYGFRQNIIFDLLLGLLVLTVTDSRNLSRAKKVLLVAAIFTVSMIIGGWPVLPLVYILIFYYGKDFKQQAKWFCTFTVSFLIMLSGLIYLNQLYHFSHYEWLWYEKAYFLGFMLALPLLKCYNGRKGDYPFGRYFFYIFYPAHFTILYLIKVAYASFGIYGVYVFMHIFCIVATLVLLAYILHVKPSKAQVSIIFFITFAVMYMIGFLIEITSSDINVLIAAIKVEYFGEALVFIGITWFISAFMRITLPKIIYAVEVIITIITLLMVFTIEYNTYFYKDIALNTDGPFPRLELTYGFGFYMFMVYAAILCLLFAVLGIRTLKRSVGIERKRILWLLPGIALPWLVSGIRALNLTGGYEITSLGIIGIVFCFAIILIRFGYFDSVQVAYENALNRRSEAVMVIKLNHYITYINDFMKKLFPELKEGMDVCAIQFFRKLLYDNEKYYTADNKIYEMKLEPLIESGYTQGYVIWSVDVTEHINNLKHIKSIAQTDSLTSLYNRNYYESTIREYLSSRQTGAMFMIDVDNFKTVNDTYGHTVGDHVLEAVGYVLKSITNYNVIPCRIGGDEFNIFVNDITDTANLSRLADSIIDNFRRTLTERKLPNEITMSIGIATTVKQDSNDMVTFEELYSNSDKALYLSKNSGKNQYHFY